jgi:two-component system, chemotaxis family, sensor histidine kinase and response regulator PixL
MTDDLDFQESLDRYFEIEAAELLQTIEQILYQLVEEEKTVERVHTLMRAAHTIKGSAANCGFKTIETIAHHLEDVFQALYPAELEIDNELGMLLIEGYQCLADPLNAMLNGITYDEAATLERTAELFTRLQTHLGDFFGRETPLPTAAELGFDVVGSIFADSVPQDLEVLAEAIATQNVAQVRESLTSLAEFLLELGGSYSLPGIAAISETTAMALQRHPDRVLEIAPIALANFQQAQSAILGGDRSVGGEVSPELNAWVGIDSSASATDDAADWLSMVEQTESDAPATEIQFADDAADWLSMVEPTESDAPATEIQFADDVAANEWLSMVNDPAAEVPAQSDAQASEWLSMLDEEPATIEFNFDTAEPAASQTSEWLSLIDEPAAAAQPAPEPVPDAQTSEWLSLVDDIATEEAIETGASTTTDSASEWLSLIDTNAVETAAPEEIIDLQTFAPSAESNGSALTRTEYAPQAGADLVLANVSGIDRILQSIAIEQPATGFDEPPAATTASKPERAPTPDAAVSVRIATAQLERLSHTIGELLIDDNQQYLRAEQLQVLAKATVEQHRRCEQKLRLVGDWADKYSLTGDRPQFATSTKRGRGRPKKTKTTPNETQSQFDSIELDVYNDLSIMLQQLTDDLAALGMQVEDLSEMAQKAKLTLSKRNQLLVEAQAELFDARMVEISTVFNRFPRLLQQMVASHRKPAQLELIGTTVSIDKIIADKLYDPLLHLVRNAYDHGVEPPEVRAQQGKPETGTLTIKAYHQGNRTTIEVRDDGQGLNWPKIRQRALDMKLLSPDRAAAATEAELAEIMFAPGFSTAEKVNDLSGRGIGLDVVRDRIGALQGTIDVRSIAGRGTTFVMQFPLNLTTARLLICESQGVVHALRSEAIAQVVLPTPDRIQVQSALSDRSSTKFLRWGEGADLKLVPIYTVNSLLAYNCPLVAGSSRAASLFPAKTKNSSSALLLLEVDNDRICLEVDRILVEQELVVKSLGETFGLPNYIQGYSVLGDGSLTLALDPVELLARVRNTDAAAEYASASKFAPLQPILQAALAPATDDAIDGEIIEAAEVVPQRNLTSSGRQLQVLIIDDSLVQRQTLTRSLTKAGCQVIQASHGREGLLRLQEHPRIQGIFCDIEMPQMNGFEFLSHCRQDAKLSQIPIYMLTTRGGQKHRQLATTLGAKGYLTKPQSEKDLLDIVAKLAQPSGVGV